MFPILKINGKGGRGSIQAPVLPLPPSPRLFSDILCLLIKIFYIDNFYPQSIETTHMYDRKQISGAIYMHNHISKIRIYVCTCTYRSKHFR
jgi:hypothetical protein